MPHVIYLGEEIGEAELLEALQNGQIDAIACGEVGNRDASLASNGELAACLNEKITISPTASALAMDSGALIQRFFYSAPSNGSPTRTDFAQEA